MQQKLLPVRPRTGVQHTRLIVTHTVLAAVLSASGMYSHAVGQYGFVPMPNNVVVPATGLPTTVWQQVGYCAGGASAVQISPSWVLSANHAPCSAGMVFRRYDGSIATVDADPTTVPGQTPLAQTDLHLSHLSKPLPYAGSFVPLVDNFIPPSISVPSNLSTPPDTRQCSATSFLLAGYGVVLTDLGTPSGAGQAFQVGWAPYANMLNMAPADPTVKGFPTPTSGDSGGGVFAFPSAYPNGVLTGLMHIPQPGITSSRGFPSVVRAQIDAVLGDATLNPTREVIQWVDASALDSPAIRPVAPKFFNAMGEWHALKIPQFGQVSNVFGGQRLNVAVGQHLNVLIPQPYSCADGTTLVNPDGGYRIRLIAANAPAGTAPRVYDTLSRNFTTPDEVAPGTYYMTVTAMQLDPSTSLMQESYAGAMVSIKVADQAQAPLQLDHVEVKFRPVDFGDGAMYWAADFTAVPNAQGPAAQGVVWVDDIHHATYRLPFNTPLTVYSFDRVPDFAAGDLLTVTVKPYADTAVGPQTTFSVPVPSTIP